MHMQAKSKKLGAVLAAIAIVVAMVASGVAIGANQLANAAASKTSNSVNVVSITTSNGMPDGALSGDVTPMQSPKSETDTSKGFNVLVNPSASSAANPPSKHGMVVVCDPDGTGNPDKQVIVSLNSNGSTYNLMRLVTPNGYEDYDGDDVNSSYEATGATVPATDITYNDDTGVLTFDKKYQAYETITVYNYLSKNQRNTEHTVYGTLELDGTANVKLRNDTTTHPTISFNVPNSSETVIGYWLGTSAGYFNGILNQMPGVVGSTQMTAGFKLDKCEIYSVVLNKSNQVVSSFPLMEGTHYTIKGDNTITFDSGLAADKILIRSKVSTKSDLIAPNVKEKTATTLTFVAAPNYKYELYKKAEDGTMELVASKKQSDVSAGLVTFNGLTKETPYWIKYISPTGESTNPMRQVRTSTEFIPYSFSFTVGSTWACNVSVGDHWNGFMSVDGGAFSQGRTIFGCTLNSVEGNDQLNQMFGGKYFNGSCISPGAGYSSGNSKNAVMKVLKADVNTGEVKVLVYMRGAWIVGGRSIQNIAGNISHQDSKIKIAVQKSSSDLSITDYNGVHNEHYSLENARFDIHAGGYDGEVIGSIYTDFSGYGESDEFPPGTYYLTEEERPKGYLEAERQVVYCPAGELTVADVPEGPETGTVKLHKDSKDPRSENNPYYNFEGIEYTLTGNTYGHVYTITLNAEGDGSADNIAYDTYTLRETKTNKWYKLSDETRPVPVTAEETNRGTTPVTINTEDEPEYVWLELDKQTADPSITEHNTGVYDLRHAKYEIVCKTPLKSGNSADPSIWLPAKSQAAEDNIIETGINKETGTTSQDPHDGYGKSAKLLYGDYEVHEILDSLGHAIDPVVYGINHEKFHPQANDLSLVPVENRTYHIVQTDKISGTSTTSGKGDLEDNADVDFSFVLNKKDDLNHGNTGQGDTDLSAIFEVRYYAVANPSENSQYDKTKPMDVWYIKTDANGQAKFDDILEYNEDGSVKMNGEYGVGKTFTGQRVEQGMVDDYTYAQNPNNGGRIYVKKDLNGTAHAVIPVGIVEIEEVVAPVGYHYESGSAFGRDSAEYDPEYDATPVVHYIYNRELKSNDTDWANGRFDTRQAEVSVSFPKGEIEEHIYRGDIMIQKLRQDDSSSLNAKIPFLITSKTTGEKHVIVTNEDGFYTSESMREAQANKRQGYSHKRDTNYNDQFLGTNEDGAYIITDESKLRYDVGTFFFGYGPNKDEANAASTEIRESDGALPHDKYVIQELRVKANEGLGLINREFTIDKDHYIVSMDIDEPVVRLHTNATDDKTGTHMGDPSGETVTIKDEVTYEGLVRNTTYTMTGTLMNKSTNQPLTDANGNKFVVSKEFNTGNDTQGRVALKFTVPSEILRGTATVVFESCVLDGIEVGTHTDINDEGQTVTFPEIHTTATDSVTEDHYGQVMNETITVVDKVECKGLVTGKEYTVSGTLMDKSTGKELVGPDGETYKANAKFTAENVDQTVELRFDVPRDVIKGKTVVAFEHLYHNGVMIGTHADINDEAQTVYYPGVHTTATDNTTGLHVGVADDETIINDKVEYKNLIEGAKYVLNGTLMDKATGEALKDADGKEITASAEFIAGEKVTEKDETAKADEATKDDETADDTNKDGEKTEDVDNADKTIKYVDGEVLVTFTVPKDVIAGHSTVVFEELQYVIGTAPDSETPEQGDKTIPVADHKDINDEGQTVYYPEIHTMAYFGEDVDLDKVLPALDQIKEFWDRIPNTDMGYVNKFIQARALSQRDTSFHMEDLLALYDKDAVADRDFNADPVTYDEIMGLLNAPSYPINPLFSHAYNRQAQVDTFTNMVTFTDTIEYKNLLVGENYIAEGTLMDKETGSPIIDNVTGNEIKATTEFSPVTPDGHVEVTFTFNALSLGLDLTQIAANVEEHKDIVVFENLFLKGNGVADDLIKVAEHADLNDELQTLPVGNFPADENENPPLIQTGDAGIAIIAIIIAANAIAFGYAYRKRRKAGII